MTAIFLVIILIFSIVIHEVSHGAVANYLGDPTAKYAGRLTLNPLKHLDPFGSVILPFFLVLMSRLTGGGIIFGWAKPVPVNPYNFRDQRWGSAKVAIAGPIANILVAVVFGVIGRFLPFSNPFFQNLYLIFSLIVYINVLLAVFNLIPIPPLDGSHILFAILPAGAEHIKLFLQQYGMFILLFFIFFAFRLILPIIFLICELIVRSPLLI